MNFNMFGFSGGAFICKKARERRTIKTDGEKGGLDKRESEQGERENRGVPETDVTLTADWWLLAGLHAKLWPAVLCSNL